MLRCPRLLFSLLALACLGGAPGAAQETDNPGNDPRFFRIGTGGAGGTYFAVGGLIANVISRPPGSRPCERGGSCGVPGLIAVAESTEGSVQNVNRIADGRMESGLVQADIAYWAYRGEAGFEERGPVEKLRVIANLYPEAMHIVVRRNAGIPDIGSLEGKRVALGARQSGTLVDARLILDAHGLSDTDVTPFYYSVDAAAAALRNGEIDAFFFVAGTPAPAIATLAEGSPVGLLQIAGPPAIALRERYPFFQTAVIAPGAYTGVLATQTIAVGAQWVVSADVEEELVYEITRALWRPENRRLMRTGHPQMRQITLDSALTGLSIPLHPGAERYYREAGLLDEEE